MRNFIKILSLWLVLSGLASAATEQAPPATIYSEDKTAIQVTASDPVFTIKLKSNPTAGYSWFVRSYDENFVQPVKHSFVPPANKKLLGAPGYEVWTFKVKPAGFVVPVQTVIRLVYARPWETTDQAKQLVFLITTD